MKTVIIHGQSHKGSTYNIARKLAQKIGGKTTEFFLPKDFGEFCVGCTNCFMKDEKKCPHYEKLKPITEAMDSANVIILASPVYVYHATGAMKAFLDHYGYRWILYIITDWLGLVPIFICMCFGVLGLVQLIKRRSLLKVDIDIILLGVYYIIVILGYLIFEMIPINYRPIPIDGYMEASYPSSTTLLVLSVMPTLKFQIDRRTDNKIVRGITTAFVISFSAFMVIGRLISGVHWLTDIIGSVILSAGLYLLYRSSVLLIDFKKEKRNENSRIERKP